MECEKHAPEEFLGKFGTKADLYNYLTIDMGLYLPKLTKTPLSFMKQILSKSKKVFRLRDINFVKVPRYAELKTEKIWPYVVDSPELYPYFPNYSSKELPDREHLWAIINTVMPDACKELVEKARLNRAPGKSEEEGEYIEIAPEIFSAIQRIEAQKPHRGKVPYLLKKASKLQRKREPQKTYLANYNVLAPTELSRPIVQDESENRTPGINRNREVTMEEEKEENKSYDRSYASASLASQSK